MVVQSAVRVEMVLLQLEQVVLVIRPVLVVQ
jgi:hypothetical protein